MKKQWRSFRGTQKPATAGLFIVFTVSIVLLFNFAYLSTPAQTGMTSSGDLASGELVRPTQRIGAANAVMAGGREAFKP